jgi:hypothetical protein
MATSQQISAWQSELAQLEAAKTAILAGKQSVSVSAGDKRIEYSPAGANNIAALNVRIAELKVYLGQSCRRALRIGF